MKGKGTARTLITKTTLKKDRGWTEALIERFLPAPDEVRTNPHYRGAAPMKLYDLARVERVESYKRFIKAKATTASRQQGAAKAVQTKRAALARFVESVKIEVPVLEPDELIRRACDNYNAITVSGDLRATPDSDPAFLERITVNYLRHQLTHYEALLGMTGGKVGAGDAYFEIKTKVLDAIADAYPDLSSECYRQQYKLLTDSSYHL